MIESEPSDLYITSSKFESIKLGSQILYGIFGTATLEDISAEYFDHTFIYSGDSQSVQISDSTFRYGIVESVAVLLCRDCNTVNITRSEFRDITSSNDAGVFLIEGAQTLEVTDCLFVNNTSQDAGAVSVTDSPARFKSCEFRENHADRNAGAVMISFN